MALMFGQLCNRESLRDVVDVLETNQPSVGSVDIYWGYHTATSQRNHPYEYRPLICQMTDSLLYSKVYFVELTLYYCLLYSYYMIKKVNHFQYLFAEPFEYTYIPFLYHRLRNLLNSPDFLFL